MLQRLAHSSLANLPPILIAPPHTHQTPLARLNSFDGGALYRLPRPPDASARRRGLLEWVLAAAGGSAGAPAVRRMLLQPNANRALPLHTACHFCLPEVVDFFVDAGLVDFESLAAATERGKRCLATASTEAAQARNAARRGDFERCVAKLLAAAPGAARAEAARRLRGGGDGQGGGGGGAGGASSSGSDASEADVDALARQLAVAAISLHSGWGKPPRAPRYDGALQRRLLAEAAPDELRALVGEEGLAEALRVEAGAPAAAAMAAGVV